MKFNKLFILLAALTLGLSACNKGGKEEGPSTPDSGESQPAGDESEPVGEDSELMGDESEPEEQDIVWPLFGEGTVTGFPSSEIEEFLSYYGDQYEVPAIGAEDVEWSYSIYVSGGYPAIYLYAVDNGEIGVDSYEDVLLGLLTEAGVTVDDSYYDDSGYVVWGPSNEVQMMFYSINGVFTLYAFSDVQLECFGTAAEMPREVIEKFYAHYFNMEVEGLVLPESAEDWSFGVDYDIDGYYFYGITADEGELGVDAIEDVYKVALTEAGWEVDDSQYDSDGYYARKDGATILFYSWEGEFDIYLY